MKFDRLRLSGFKSFVEPTELHILPGLTAIVGPNGCGKSNLFDALRWVMGESRPTSVRGGEMDDVIFAGSAGRPARNMAEVVLAIDNAERSANPPYNDGDTIEVSRRIEREAGSSYRINGRDVRQKDVQLFFADASSGAGSTAFVRQGQIGQLVSQKPMARRQILEEAAGVSGLHQRRHEAELRLKGAEANLARLTDVIGEVEGQLNSLKRQARLASRYRNLSGHIRKAEALAHLLRWNAAEARRNAATAALAEAVRLVEDATAIAARAAAAQTEAASDLPPLRDAEAEKSAALHRLVLAREALDAEEARAREWAQSLRQRLEQTGADCGRETALIQDAETALAGLDEEAEGLRQAQQRASAETQEAETAAAACAGLLAEAEAMLEKLTADLAERNARFNSLTHSKRVAEELAETSAQQLAEASEKLDAAMSDAAEAPDVRAAEKAVEAAREIAEQAAQNAAAARAALTELEAQEAALRAPLEQAEAEAQRLAAEVRALSDVIAPQAGGLWPPLVDAVQVRPGYEAALAAALGDDLEAPLDEAAPKAWRDLGGFDGFAPLPPGATPLSEFVAAPSALTRRLSMTGVVEAEQGAALQASLQPGQRLVSARGDLWRWDGYRASADAPTAEAVRLAQRNRLAELERNLATAKEKKSDCFAEYSAAKTQSQTAREAAREADQSLRQSERAILEAQNQAAKAARAAAERASKLASLEAEIRRLSEARDAAILSAGQAGRELAELGDGIALQHEVARAREDTAEARSRHSAARAALDGLKRDGEMRIRRLEAIGGEQTRWAERREEAARHIGELRRRQEELTGELTEAEALPAAIAEKRGSLIDAIAIAEAARAEALDARNLAEARLAEADKCVKAADKALGAAREERARAEAQNEGESARIGELEARIRDELECAPDELPMRAEIKDDAELPPLDIAEKKVEKLKAERESLGGVNLRAEEEAAEQETRLQGLMNDRDDLSGAIEKLHRGIQSLNREGRERLAAAFEKVNVNFQELFAKLFQGGEARLTFTESEDPLEAGLEIFARPPGKKLQSLTLLSGGEQALTAMALILAVFMVNPAPVCVLDEVDAPLDDANVERFCNLLDEMVRLTDTRFLVITHHALTMSRMHRLFGVTMSERGVSQLVSVSLAEAEKAAAE